MRERKTILTPYLVSARSLVMSLEGRVIGQVVSVEQVSKREPLAWSVELDVEHDADLERLQIMPLSGITGSING